MTRPLPGLQQQTVNDHASGNGLASGRLWFRAGAAPGLLRLLGLLLLMWHHDAQAVEGFIHNLTLPTLRLDLGVAGQLTPQQLAHFALDVHTGAAVFLGPHHYRVNDEKSDQLVLLPEVGYSFDKSTLHAFSAGVGVGYGGLLVYGALTPRFVVGMLNGDRVLGVRTCLSTQLFSMLNIELSHQFLSGTDLLRHDVRFTVGLDLGHLAARVLIGLAQIG